MNDSIPQDIPLKQCSKCKQLKPSNPQYFHRDKRREDGLFPQCKQCCSRRKPSDVEPGFRRCSRCKEVFPETLQYFQHTIRRRGENLTSACKMCLSKSKKARYQANIEEARLYARKQYVKHKDRRTASSRARYAANPLSYREKRLRYLSKPGAKQRQYEHIYEYYRRPGIQERRREYMRAYGHNRRVLIRNKGRTLTAKDVQQQYKAQKGKCYWCGKKLEKYHIDHIVPVSRGGSNEPSNVVLACPTCNHRKSSKLPHEWPEGNRLL